MMRTHYCGEPDTALIDQTLKVAGWVHRRRDHGGVIFIDLRDHTGLLQVVFDPDQPELFAQAERLRNEFVIAVEGRLRARPDGTQNTKRKTGAVELYVSKLMVLNRSEPVPFQLDDDSVGEDTRLRYRYLDLRRESMQHNLRLRHRIIHYIREQMDAQGFVDIETPILTRATPEGARDYLVPSRTHPGEFFALPQSPQLFKQLLMISGFDRYYQIARCFRDEDLRADRQPEFTQLDVETAFLGQDEIMQVMENLLRGLFKAVLDVTLPQPFPRMTWAEAMRRFGSDKPDLRNPLELVDVKDLLADVAFKVFSGPANDDACRVSVLRIPGGREQLSRGQIDACTEYVKHYGAKGLAYIVVNDVTAGREGLQSPIVKNLHDAALAGILERCGAEDGDVLFFGADKSQVVSDALGALRLKLGRELGLTAAGWRPLWVVDWPMFERDVEGGRWVALHHPFTAPATESAEALRNQPGQMLSQAYDIVLNGIEAGGGSVRIHQPEMQQAVFELLGIDEQEQQEKFGFLLDALACGAPPHGGIALGLDRLTMLMVGAESIREVIAFPKTQSAACPLTAAPGTVSSAQLRELGLRLRELPQTHTAPAP